MFWRRDTVRGMSDVWLRFEISADWLTDWLTDSLRRLCMRETPFLCPHTFHCFYSSTAMRFANSSYSWVPSTVKQLRSQIVKNEDRSLAKKIYQNLGIKEVRCRQWFFSSSFPDRLPQRSISKWRIVLYAHDNWPVSTFDAKVGKVSWKQPDLDSTSQAGRGWILISGGILKAPRWEA